MPMTRMVSCHKLKVDLPGLANPPWPGELGERVFNTISAKAWEMWLRYQTIIINENRLNTTNSEHREVIVEQLKYFLFDE